MEGGFSLVKEIMAIRHSFSERHTLGYEDHQHG